MSPSIPIQCVQLWRRARRSCSVLIGEYNRYPFLVQAVDGQGQIVREQPADTAEHAALIGAMWAEQEDRSIYGCLPPDLTRPARTRR